MRLWPRKKPVPVVVEPEPELAPVPEPEPEPSGRYDGSRCWVPADEFADNGDGTFSRVWEGGWHYSTRIDDNGYEVPDRKLHLRDVGGEDEWFYEYAEPGHRSWVEKHGVGQIVQLGPLPTGVEYPPEAKSDHPEHNKYRRFHLGAEEIGSKET